MSISAGTRSLMDEVVTWAVVAAMCAGMLTYYDELKQMTGLSLGASPAQQSADAAATGPQPDEHSGYSVELRAGNNGHFSTPAEVNGRDIEVMVDTGASMVALTYEDAERAGIYLNDSDFTGRVSTANGAARVAPITLDRVSIGDITVRNVEAVVSQPGNLHVTLLGMTFLSRLDRVDMRSGRLLLQD